MADVKMIFFDIDGTLVDPKTHQISPKTKEALHRLHGSGIKLCIVTGRPTASLPDLSDLPFDAFATFNGSLCTAGETLIYSNPIPRDAVERVLRNAAGLGRPVSVAGRHRMVANGFDQDLADYYALAELKLTVAEDFDTVCREPVYQIMLGCREPDHPAILQGVQGVKIAVSWDRAVDVIPESSGKGTAIAHILAYYGLEPSQTLAFGDSYNDLEMFRAVGSGIAMGNAAQALKDIAGDVCLPVSEDGIYHYCISQGLI